MLTYLKTMLGFSTDDTDIEERLALIIESTTARLKVKLGGIEPPEELEYIIKEVAIKRFNRIGSEGLESHSVEGENLSFEDDYFNEFADDIQAFLDKQKEVKRGKVRFI